MIEKILKPKEYKRFIKWMEGQTTDMNGVYEDDFIRFVKGLGVTD
jgi:hypothetical protein